jgi:serine/threonine protein kinase
LCLAVGILAYECLVGQTPYEAETVDQALELIEARALFVDRRPDDNNRRARHRLNNRLSQDARDFILACLDVEPATRLTAQEMLSHPWIVSHHPQQQAPPTPPTTTTTREAPRDALHVSSDDDPRVAIGEPEHRGSSSASSITQHLGEVQVVSGPTTTASAAPTAAAAPMPHPPPSCAGGMPCSGSGGGGSSAAAGHLDADPTAAPRPPLVKAATYNSGYALPDPRDGGGRRRSHPCPATATIAAKRSNSFPEWTPFTAVRQIRC